MAETDPYIVEQCLNGHPDEFRVLVHRYQAALSAYLFGKLGNRSFTEEAAQETFVRAYFGLSELKKRDSFYSWLLGIANRVAKEQLRNHKPFVDVDPLASATRKENDIQGYELEHAIAELPDSDQELVHLRFFMGLSCSQIAERQHVPIGTITKQLSRAYAKLRGILSDGNEVHG